MRVMGIDPGLTRCGIGIVEVDVQRRAHLVYVDVIRSDTKLAWHFRLDKIYSGLETVIREHQPEIIAVERVFAKENLQSVTTTMQVMGIALLAAARASLPCAVHTPSEVKAAVTGSGTAGKAQVQHMVARILGLPKVPKPADAADALAIAITQGWRGTGILGEGADADFTVSLSGAVNARQKLTPAQRIWAQAQAATRQTGAVDPKRRNRK